MYFNEFNAMGDYHTPLAHPRCMLGSVVSVARPQDKCKLTALTRHAILTLTGGHIGVGPSYWNRNCTRVCVASGAVRECGEALRTY